VQLVIADAHHVHEQLEAIAGMLGRQFPKLEAMLRDSPVPYWSKPTTNGRSATAAATLARRA
jgi:hypothetical protein